MKPARVSVRFDVSAFIWTIEGDSCQRDAHLQPENGARFPFKILGSCRLYLEVSFHIFKACIFTHMPFVLTEKNCHY